MTRCILINTIQTQLHGKVKDSFAVEAGSGPRHLTFSKRELCLCAGTYWRSDGLFLFERKVEKVDQTTILANGLKELSPEPTSTFLLTENLLQTVGKRIRFQPLEF
jgi:hypothetical protein